jgi:hypothetical protein
MTTEFLKLILTDKSEVSMAFLDWRTLMNGTEESNMILIDRAVSLLNRTVAGKADGFSYNPETGRLYLTTDGVNIEGAFVDIKLKDCYTKKEIDDIIKNLANSDALKSMQEELGSLGDAVGAIQDELSGIDAEGYTYYATYGEATLPNGETAENVYTLWEVKEDQEQVKSQFVLAGGGGGASSTNLVIERITPSPLILTPTDKAEIRFLYSSTDSDGQTVDGNYILKRGSTPIAQGVCVHGENVIDLEGQVSIGTHKFTLTVTDDGGSTNVKTWTIQVVDLRLESAFTDDRKYTAGEPVSFTYVPYGSVKKTVHFILDGTELPSVETSASGVTQTYTLPAQVHGAHLLDVYITADINNVPVTTDHIYRDIVWFDDASDVPVISCVLRADHYGKIQSRQYAVNEITYRVFDPATNAPTVQHIADGVEVSEETLEGSTNTWYYRTDVIGDHTLTIKCGEAEVTVQLDVEALGIDVTPVTSNLAFDFNPVGRNNASADRLWQDSVTGVKMQVSDNFNWQTGGYQTDDDGDQCFVVKAGTTATINYGLFSNDASVDGATFKCVFRVRNVRDVDAKFLSCAAGSTKVGLEMNAHAAYLHTSATGAAPLYIPYAEENTIEFEYVINPLTGEKSYILSYEDGVGLRPLVYDDGHRLYQYAAESVPITIGSPDCDVYIYRMKAYTAALNDAEMMQNFIADARDVDEMISRHDRNQIYDENGNLTPDSVAKACPHLKVIKIDAPYFTADKNEMVKNTNVECAHTGGDPVLDNWIARNCYHSGQGTTSNEYGFAGRNLNIYMCFDGVYQHKRVTYDPEYITELTLGDGTTVSDGTGKVTLTRGSIPNSLYNIKVNIASSENANNAKLAMLYDRYLPYTPVSKRRDPKAKTTMEFVNCVVFIRENDPDISKHREFQDTEWHFYALGNIGDSKDTDQTRTYDPDDHMEFVVEISDNTKPNSIFPTGVAYADGEMVYPITPSQWVPGNPAYDSLYDNFDETFEFRYTHPDITDAEEVACVDIWKDFYKFVVTSTNEEFKEHLKDWFVEEAAIYGYLFTEHFTMTDNRAKNTFWHWAKVYISQAEATAMGEEKAKRYTIDDAAAAIHDGYRLDFWDYDNDTSLGINNSGELTQPYGKEDIDYRTDGDPSSGYVFNAADSVFFRRVRYLLHDKLAAMYKNRESAGAWNCTTILREFREWQAEFPEALWVTDFNRKYKRTFEAGEEGTQRFLKTMYNGRKLWHREQWLTDQTPYTGTKYVGTAVTKDQIMFRCNTPLTAVVAPNYDLEIVPYADMYISVLYGNSSAPIQIRAKAGQTYTIENPLGDSMNDTAILIYNASRIQAINDLSGCYIHDNDFSKAEKLQRLVIGSAVEGYQNTFMTDFNLGNNALLEYLDLRGCPNLTGTLNLAQCGNLETLHAQGTSIAGVTFATSGAIQNAYLPTTLNALVMRKLLYLTGLHATYDNLETLTEEESIVDELAIVQDAADTLQTLRLTGIDWTLRDTSILNQIVQMDNAVLSGKVYVESIKSSELDAYTAAWPDLEISYTSFIPQYLVTFNNWDGSELYRIYVDRGSGAADPVESGFIETPTKESTVSTVYTYTGWDRAFNAIIEPTIVTAQYSESIRQYTVRWFSQVGVVDETQVVDYGSEAVYSKGFPTHSTEEEEFLVYYLFDKWDKSTGFVDRDIDVNAIWFRGELPPTGTDIGVMNPAQIYAIIRNNKASEYFTLKDRVPIEFGYRPEYTNIPFVDVANELYFDGSTHIDTGIQLLKNGIADAWTLVADITLTSDANGQTMVSCMQEDGYMGFKVKCSTGVAVQWGTNSTGGTAIPKARELVVIRHESGSRNVTVYKSNHYYMWGGYGKYIMELTKAIDTQTDTTLTLGAAKLDNGTFTEYAKGMLHSCRIWYGDLGDADCRNIINWTREVHPFEVCGFGDYKLATDRSQNTSVDFICADLLDSESPMSKIVSDNTDDYTNTKPFVWFQERVYYAFPNAWRQLMKLCEFKHNCRVDGVNGIKTSSAYLWNPSIAEMTVITVEPNVYEGKWIPYFIDNYSRIKYRCMVPAEGCTTFTSSEDPANDPNNNVKEGDVWNKGKLWYIRRYREWLESSTYRLRNASLDSDDRFGAVMGDGATSNNNCFVSSNPRGYCPRFSI